ncbi:MAG: nitrate reductase [Deltaproteobacteria bacterium]|nr:nitrate reductase [Deltaproteobacteria bacterium]
MHDVYNFVSGPLVWVSFIIFFGGCLYRLISMAVLAKKKDVFVYEYMSFKYGLRSIFHWIIPFGTVKWRKNPILTIVTFTFHICLILVPIFLCAHVILWKESWDIGWWYFSDTTADILTGIVIACCVFFLIRRIVLPEVKYLTSVSDYVILAMVAAPFITGFWTYHQWPGCKITGIVHIIAGEIMLAAIPFTRLIHMVYFPFTRGYMGSEFGAVRNAKDW